MSKRLWDVARVVRSKNSGPYMLTLDVIFADERTFDAVREQRVITARRVAALYGVDPGRIAGIVWFRPANAVKITLPRPVPSGHPGDTDVYGAQQYAPLADIEVEVP